MIVSPRAKQVIDIVRIENQQRIVEIDEVFLLRRDKDGTYKKTWYWKRGEDNTVSGDGSCCYGQSTHQKTCVILAEADYDLSTSRFDHAVRVLNGECVPTETTIQLDHIIETNHEQH